MWTVPVPPRTHDTTPEASHEMSVTLIRGRIPDIAMIDPRTSRAIELPIRCAQSPWRKGWKMMPGSPSVESGRTP